MTKTTFNVDERTRNIVYRICTLLYYVTMLSMIGIMFYRQFVFNQPLEEFQDIANILTANVIILLCAVFYFSGITFSKFKPKSIVLTFLVFVTIGFLFTLFKYKVLTEEPLSMSGIFGKLHIIVIICGILTALWTFFAYLGKRRMDKNLE